MLLSQMSKDEKASVDHNTRMSATMPGRKVFFLYPPTAIHDELIHALFKQGYEAYSLTDHQQALELIKKFNDSILTGSTRLEPGAKLGAP